MDKIIIDKILNEYVTNKLTAKAIAIKYGYGKTTILKLLRRKGIVMRKLGDYGVDHKLLSDKNWCENQYFVLGKSVAQIALELNVYYMLVIKYFNQHDIKRFDSGRYQPANTITKEELKNCIGAGKSIFGIAKEKGYTHKVIARLIKKYELNIDNYNNKRVIDVDKETLYQWYVENNKSTTTIASILKCNKRTVIKKLKQFNIPIKPARSYFKSTSKLEMEIADLVSTWPYDIKLNCREFGPEIDIFIPDLKFGIEVNGEYFHSILFKQPEYHTNKFLYYHKIGICLFTIWESDWYHKRQWVLYKLKKAVSGIKEYKTVYDLDYEPHEYVSGSIILPNHYKIDDKLMISENGPYEVYRTGMIANGPPI